VPNYADRYEGAKKILRMRIFLFGLLLFPSAVVLAEPGFWAIDDIDIPAAIRRNGDSVYQVIVLQSSRHEILSKVGYNATISEQRRRLEADMEKDPTEMPSGDLGGYYQIESCIKFDKDQCEIYKTIALGTAFEASLYPDTSTLWTSYHNVEGVIKNYLEREGLGDSDKMINRMEIPLNILLVNKNREVVFDTRINGQSAKIIDFARGIGVVQIQLSETIGRPLLFGEHRGIGGRSLEDIYMMGFPLVQRDETKREDFYAYPLKRYDLSVTIGEIFLRPAHGRHASEARRIECDADSALGMSGAPVFNKRGEVIGIFIKPIAFKVGSVLTPTNQIYTYFRAPLSLSHVHDPDIEVAHAVRVKGDLLSIWAP
jgi:hypothetical protein